MARVRGAEQIQRALKQQNELLVKGVLAGTIDASAEIESKSNKIAPRDTGFLRLSSFTIDSFKRGSTVVGRVGYDAKYAAMVHEMPESNNFTEAGTGPKFLERAVKDNPRRITKVFYDTIRRFVASWR